ASIQRRVTTSGGRRKTQPTVRDGLTTTKDAIQSEDGDELTGQISLEILITELDVEKQTCKFRLLNEPDQTDEDGNPLRFSGKITDPEIESQGNKYSMSLALGTPLKAKGKARMRDGYIKIFFISDAE
ncbi:hypothetical protein ACOWPS_20770, partial [Pseudomonas aeruginosa]|uniref:DUF7947 five-stranded beta-barrel domain-containing protein n=2 Tax=Pseudomonas aeruginosa TaxID=287 RepID=UPI003BA92612